MTLSDPLLSASGQDDKAGFVRNQPFDFFMGDHEKGVELTPEIFNSFKQKTISYRENIKQILASEGSKSVYDYTKQFNQENRNKVVKIRRPQVISVIAEFTRRTLGSAISEGVSKQLKENSSVATVHHHVPLGHPYVLNPTLQMALPYFLSSGQNPGLQKIIVLACANVSFNNFEFPSGHLLHSNPNNLHQLRFFGHTVDAKPVIFHAPYTNESNLEIKSKLMALRREGKISQAQSDELIALFDEVYSSPHVLSSDTYVDQVTISNYWLFKKMFRNYKKFVPDLVFLSQELIVLELLQKFHLSEQTTIHQLIFGKDAESLLTKYVEGIEGTFNTKTKEGTYLFWARPKTGKYREQLWKKGNKLVTDSGSFSVDLNPEALSQAITRNELIPSVFLVYVTLGLYYGLILSGGPAQTMVLPNVQKAYLKIVEELSHTQSYEAASDLITNSMLLSRPSLAYVQSDAGRLPATGLDIYGASHDRITAVFESMKQVTLEEIVNRALPSYYYEFVSQQQKDEVFSRITPHDIEQLTGLDKKIPALSDISTHL